MEPARSRALLVGFFLGDKESSFLGVVAIRSMRLEHVLLLCSSGYTFCLLAPFILQAWRCPHECFHSVDYPFMLPLVLGVFVLRVDLNLLEFFLSPVAVRLATLSGGGNPIASSSEARHIVRSPHLLRQTTTRRIRNVARG